MNVTKEVVKFAGAASGMRSTDHAEIIMMMTYEFHTHRTKKVITNDQKFCDLYQLT